MPPKKRHTRHRRDKRRAQSFRLTVSAANKCPQCAAAVTPHRVCPSCGFYNGTLVMPKKVKKAAGSGGTQGSSEGQQEK